MYRYSAELTKRQLVKRYEKNGVRAVIRAALPLILLLDFAGMCISLGMAAG
ncbi:MAG TPA: hypothetical protein VFX35_07680 [Solirubrobacterales bacterium]|nr:hypothetical protein [Solirubrobacterales bacterium]